MGTPYSSIVGAISTFPTLGSIALIAKLQQLADYRFSEIPPASNRASQVYITQGAGGSNTGGGGAGTLASPYVVRHMADLRTLIASIGGANLGVLFARGAIIYSDASNTDQGITISWDNVTLGAYGSGDRPELSGFGLPPVAPVISGSVATYSGLGALRAYWVRGRNSGTDRSSYADQPYTKAASAISATATPYSFFDDGAGTVTVNFGTHSYTTIEFAYATGAGVLLSNNDGLGVDDIISEGWGMNTPGAAGGGMCFRSQNSGTNTHVYRRIKALWGPYHSTAQIVTAASGGIISWFDCEWGFHQWDSGGTGDANVCYNQLGGQEFLRRGCKQYWGGLQAEGVTVTPQGPYAHTGGGAVYPAIGVDLDSIINPLVGAALNTLGFCGDQPTITNARDISQYITFRHNRQAVTKGTSGSNHGFESNARITYMLSIPSGPFAQPFGAGSSATLKGVWVNVDMTFVLAAGSWSGKGLRIFDATAPHEHDQVHCRRRIIGPAPSSGVALQIGTHLSTSAEWNCVLSNETGSSIDYTGGTLNHYYEQDPNSFAGGVAGPATFGVPSNQTDGVPSPVLLSSAGNWTSRSEVPASCRTSVDLPTGLACEYDINMVLRSSTSTSRFRGPIEGADSAFSLMSFLGLFDL